MIKTLITLLRGRGAEAVAPVADANALTILDQQIRDATGHLERARRALAIAMAQDAAEAHRADALRGRIAALESSATAALAGGRDDLAQEAAAAIAALEADLATAVAARTSFAREWATLDAMTTNAARRLAELERGRRIARAAEAVRRLRAEGASRPGGGSALQDAEATLRRLRQRQGEDAAAALEAAADPGDSDLVSEKLRAAGFGDAVRATPARVLERLRDRQLGFAPTT